MVRRYTSALLLAFISGVYTPLLFAACGGGEPPCVDCGGYGAGAVECFTGGTSQVICAPDQDLAAITCIEYGGTWSPLTVCPVAPEETGDGPGAAPFDPSRDVTFDRSAGEYVLDRIAFEELKLDPAPLFGDTTELRPHELGHELVVNGELSAALGWQVGDVLLDLDGYPLHNLDEFSVAYTTLAENSNFALSIRRGRSDIVLRYRIE